MAGLSDGRLALVHRYMIDAEEAEVLARAEEMERRRAEPLIAGASTTKPEAVEEPMRAVAPVTKVAPGAVEEAARGSGRPDPRDEARARKALVKADKSAAKQAARQMAALEKKEARERKALAKAAARRKTA